MRTDLRNLDEYDITELFLRIFGDADRPYVALDLNVLMRLGVPVVFVGLRHRRSFYLARL
ncbi:MAG TPA: hypothetical protein VIU37_05950 [Candidatus Limnocylindrales bacterium]